EIFCFIHLHLYKISYTYIILFGIQYHFIIHFRRIIFGTTNEIVAIHSIYQYFKFFTNFSLVDIKRYALLYLHNCFYTLLFYFFLHINRQRMRMCDLFVKICNTAYTNKTGLLLPFQHFLEILLGLAWITTNQCYTPSDIRLLITTFV